MASDSVSCGSRLFYLNFFYCMWRLTRHRWKEASAHKRSPRTVSSNALRIALGSPPQHFPPPKRTPRLEDIFNSPLQRFSRSLPHLELSHRKIRESKEGGIAQSVTHGACSRQHAARISCSIKGKEGDD